MNALLPQIAETLLSSSALSPIDADAEMIATCAAICDLERAYDALGFADEDDTPESKLVVQARRRIVVHQDAFVERLCELPCTTLAGVQAMATALAAWDRELLKDGTGDTDEIITSQMVKRILALRAPTADADLLAVCAEFCGSEAAYWAIYDGDDRVLSDEECAVLGNPIAASWDGMLNRMAQLRATTSEGLAARAIVLAQHSGIKPGTDHYPFAFEPDDPEDVTGRLLHMLLADAVQIGSSAPDPDADLLALRPEFDRLHALMIDYNKDLLPDGGTECADFDALCRRIAMSAPAATAEGRAFQAAAAMHDMTYRMHEGDQDTCAVWLMLKGLAGAAFRSVEARS